MGSSLVFLQSFSGVITAQRANVRAAPTLKSPSIMTLEQGTELLVEYEHNGWNLLSPSTTIFFSHTHERLGLLSPINSLLW